MANLGVKVGNTVFDADGKRLGKVTRCDPWGFQVKRGFFSLREWVMRYDEILELGENSVKIARSDSDLIELAEGKLPHSWGQVTLPDGEAPLPAAPGERSAQGERSVADERSAPDERSPLDERS